MSDRYQTLTLLDPAPGHDAPAATADSVLRWLANHGVIAAPRGRGRVYRPGPRANDYLARDPAAWPDWAASASARLSGGGRFHGEINDPVDATCPACGRVTPGLFWHEPPLFAVLESIDAEPTVDIRCAHCGAAADVRRWHFDPPIAIADVGVDFENWPELSPTLVDDLQSATGRLVRLVRWRV